MATRELLAELLRHHRGDGGPETNFEAAGGVDVLRRIESGEAFDAVVLASAVIDKLIAAGRLMPGRIDIARSGVVAAVRAGAPKPEFSDEPAVRRAVLAARTLSYSTGPSGQHLETLFERWGIREQLRSRIVVAPPGTPVAALVADGRAELGFQQLSEMQGRAGIEIVGPLPPALQIVTIFSGGIAAGGSQPAAAQAVLRYCASLETHATKQQYGMDAG